jgi:hypothetical protein
MLRPGKSRQASDWLRDSVGARVDSSLFPNKLRDDALAVADERDPILRPPPNELGLGDREEPCLDAGIGSGNKMVCVAG